MNINGITYLDNFIDDSIELFDYLKKSVDWDKRMVARKTASFGEAYNYSQITYPFKPFPEQINELRQKINHTVGFIPNNCLINYYLDGKSKMGFHSDQTDILTEGTGVVILSLGETRTLRFRNIHDKNIVHDYPLETGSLFFMTNQVQESWQHAVPKSNTDNGRMSLTFRELMTN